MSSNEYKGRKGEPKAQSHARRRGARTAGKTFPRRVRGLEPIRRLVQKHTQKFEAQPAFSFALLLGRWSEIVGADIASMSKPASITYNRGKGAVLKLLTTSAFAPILSLQNRAICARINQFYGYKAIGKITFLQTMPHDFKGEAQEPPSAHKQQTAPQIAPSSGRGACPPRAKKRIEAIKDDGLRGALDAFASSVSRKVSRKNVT